MEQDIDLQYCFNLSLLESSKGKGYAIASTPVVASVIVAHAAI